MVFSPLSGLVHLYHQILTDSNRSVKNIDFSSRLSAEAVCLEYAFEGGRLGWDSLFGVRSSLRHARFDQHEYNWGKAYVYILN
jgi:hypothetical protein